MSPDSLNVLTSALRDYCREHVLEEKVILAPSHRVGFQWLDAVARSGQPVFNARADTLRRVALGLAMPRMEKAGLRVLRGMCLEVAVDGIVSDILTGPRAAARRRGTPYLAGLSPSPGLTRTVAGAIQELRVAGITSSSIKPRAFEVEEKGLEVREVLHAYEEMLEKEGFADYASMLGLARDVLRDEPGALGVARLLLPAGHQPDLRGLERAVWDAVPEANRHILPDDKPCCEPGGEAMTDAMLLRWVTDPGDAPAPRGDGTARIMSAVGEVNEVREVFRFCVQNGVPLDEVEVVYTETDSYTSHFYELGVRMMPEGAEDLPVTFAEGIPARYSRPGRALAAWLSWVREGFPQQPIVRMIQDGLLKIPGAQDEDFKFARLGAILRTVPIGAGLERHVSQVERTATGVRRRLEEAAVSQDGEEDDEHTMTENERERLARRLEGLELLGGFLSDLVSHTPTVEDDQLRVLDHAIYFLENFARSLSKMDAYCLRALLERVIELSECLGEAGTTTSFDMRAWLEDLPGRVRVGGKGPAPGCLHVSNLKQGGNSGRPHTFIIGLDDTRFPGAGLQDPLLLDSERAIISPDLVTAPARIESKIEGFARMLAGLRGDVTLSYCARNLSDDREMFPSRILISVRRILTGEPVTLLELDEAPESFAPADAGRCIDMTEWWLWRMCAAGRFENPRAVIGDNFANLARGFEALAARASDVFTEYDGYVPAAGPANDCTMPTGPIISPSRLETLARCPMEYFFKHVLGVKPPDEYEVDPVRWLDPLEQGNLLHAVFCDFMRELEEAGTFPPDFDRDRPALMRILDRYVEARKVEKPPPPNPDVFAAGYRFLKDTADTFLDMEEAYCRDHLPVACELAIGVVPEGRGTSFDMEEPVDLPLPDGRTVRVRCKLDRVDRVMRGDGSEYVVRDYKTGGSQKFHDNGPFHCGRFMQGALYPVLAELALRAKLGQDVKVVWFEYMFPNPWERTLEGWPVTDLERGLDLVGHLCDMVSSGCYAFTTEASDLEWSDYKAAFGDIDAAVDSIKRKLENRANSALDAYRVLRAEEQPEGEAVPDV